MQLHANKAKWGLSLLIRIRLGALCTKTMPGAPSKRACRAFRNQETPGIADEGVMIARACRALPESKNTSTMPERIHKRHFPTAMIMVPGIFGITVAQVFERKNRSIPDLHAAVKHRPGILTISAAQILERRSRGSLHLAAAVIDVPPVDNISSLTATVLRVSGPHLRALLRPDTGPMFRAMRRTMHRRVSGPPRPAATRRFRLLRRADIRPALRRPLCGKHTRSQCRCKRHRSKHHCNRSFHIRFSFLKSNLSARIIRKNPKHTLYI